MTKDTIEGAHKRLTARFIGRDGVSGTAIGLCGGEPCIRVYLSGGGSALRSEIPGRFEGHRVVVEESGEFEALGG